MSDQPEPTPEDLEAAKAANEKLANPTPNPFQTGDIVQLKTGGPSMTLGQTIPEHTSNNQVECSWFDNYGGKFSNWFFLGMLKKLTQEEAEKAAQEASEVRKQRETSEHELRSKAIDASKEVELAKIAAKK